MGKPEDPNKMTLASYGGCYIVLAVAMRMLMLLANDPDIERAFSMLTWTCAMSASPFVIGEMLGLEGE
jgi:hypothetical protein